MKIRTLSTTCVITLAFFISSLIAADPPAVQSTCNSTRLLEDAKIALENRRLHETMCNLKLGVVSPLVIWEHLKSKEDLCNSEEITVIRKFCANPLNTVSEFAMRVARNLLHNLLGLTKGEGFPQQHKWLADVSMSVLNSPKKVSAFCKRIPANGQVDEWDEDDFRNLDEITETIMKRNNSVSVKTSPCDQSGPADCTCSRRTNLTTNGRLEPPKDKGQEDTKEEIHRLNDDIKKLQQTVEILTQKVGDLEACNKTPNTNDIFNKPMGKGNTCLKVQGIPHCN